jgi:myosin heavy subunit
VDGLPTELAVEELVTAQRLLKKSHQCVICDKAVATSLCLDCHDLFCGACKAIHKKQKVSSHHRLEDLKTLSADQLSSGRPSPCPDHREETCKLYCPAHHVPICHLCAASRHRTCADVIDLRQKADERREALQDHVSKLRAAERELEAAVGELGRHQQDTEKKARAHLAELRKVCDDLKAAVEACYQRSQNKVQQLVADNKAAVQEAREGLQLKKGRAASNRRTAENAARSANPDTVTKMASVVDQRVRELDVSVTLPDKVKVITQLTFEVDRAAVKRMEKELSGFLDQVQTSLADLQCQRKTPMSQPFVGKNPKVRVLKDLDFAFCVCPCVLSVRLSLYIPPLSRHTSSSILTHPPSHPDVIGNWQLLVIGN